MRAEVSAHQAAVGGLATATAAAAHWHSATHARPNSFGGDFGPRKPDFVILLATLAHLSLDDDASPVCALMEIKKGARNHFDDQLPPMSLVFMVGESTVTLALTRTRGRTGR